MSSISRSRGWLGSALPSKIDSTPKTVSNFSKSFERFLCVGSRWLALTATPELDEMLDIAIGYRVSEG
jgi:hypothetical protein